MAENRIDTTFAQLRRRQEAAFMPFITAGDPDYDTTRRLILEYERGGADLIELGIPFSDPIADGPTIQASFARALQRGATVQAAFEMVHTLRTESEIPVLTMVSMTIISRFGQDRFIEQAAAAGVDGVIVPDLPVEEAEAFVDLVRQRGLHVAFLVAPTTPPERARLVADRSSGFIYYVSVTGTTGARDTLPEDMRRNIAALRKATQKPIALGFGVSTPEQAAAVAREADGVIVGSALVKRIGALADGPRDHLISEVGALAGALAKATKNARRTN